ncbi:hypothetical protein SASPL_116730 [Salvia splendens]|uniref:NOTCH1 EGF-like calcium-binding domain-containing protein n=1 Tax=Salvia splendens TaxID=180675 RepID=A0A8X8XTI1_SALSN|nr:hypothetical protein SASPL_116730 [Salvia splendens]
MNCSADAPFTIGCNESFNPPRPFFMVQTGFEELVDISLATKTVKVMQSVSPLNCSKDNKMRQLAQPMAASYATFSSIYNRLVVVGCQNVVSLLPSNGECNPICALSSTCEGMNCCQREIEFFYRNPNVDTNASLTCVLEWEFEISNATTLPGVQCEKNEFPFFLLYDGQNMSTTICSCKPGYQGNPYLSCEDVDECRNSSLNKCQIGTTCVNTAGSFLCQVQGDSKGAKMNTVIIGISCGLGGLVLLGGALVFSKIVRKRIQASLSNLQTCDEETEPAMSIAVYDSLYTSDTTGFSTATDSSEFPFLSRSS